MRTERFILLLRVLFLLIVFPPGARGQNAEDLYQKMQTLSPEKRHQLLVEGAKKEGTVMIYGTFSRPDQDALLAEFRKKYPFIEPQLLREGRGAALADRALAEIRAGRHIVDVMGGGDTALPPLLKAAALARYNSPERKYYPKDYRDDEGYWTAAFVYEWVFGYNSRLVDRAKLPANYFDLLDPYWKGKLVLDPLPNFFVRGALIAYGEEKAMDLFRRIVEHGLNFRRGRTLQTQLLAAGEFFASPEQNLATLAKLKGEGAPLEFRYIYPSPVSLGPVAVFKTAPHPHAAALFVDFWLSAEGQKVMTEREYSVMREGMRSTDSAAARAQVAVRPDWVTANEDKVQQINQEIFTRKAKGGEQKK
jgi:iron(III) transport system substrate-binding protein